MMNSLPNKALSIRAPWWWWIVHGHKQIENRDWPTNFRGPVWIHASKWWSKIGFDEDWESARAMERASGKPMVGSGLWSPERIRSVGGHIVGIADVVDCVSQSDSPWFVGKFGFVLSNARPVTPIPCKGALGFFTVPSDVLAALVSPSSIPGDDNG